MTVNLNQVITRYVELRAERTALEATHKEQLAPIKESMQMLEAAMHKLMDEQGVKSTSVAGVGTAYKQKWTSTRVSNWGETLDWIVAGERWDLLTQAVNKTAVLDEMTKMDPTTGEVEMVSCPVPGVEDDGGFKVLVRRI